MFYSLRNKLSRLWFDHSCKEILKTSPLNIQKNDIRIVSMVSHKDLIMYLIAIKSFYKKIHGGIVVVINDGSLTAGDQALLREHISYIDIVNINEISTGKCPRGGTWERLSYICQLAQNHYVIQLDSDTVTQRDCPEITDCVENNISFTSVGCNSTLRVETLADAANQAICSTGTGAQRIFERAFCQLTKTKVRYYLRGNSAFAGFSKNSFKWDDIEMFSVEMGSILKDDWMRWGSEQVASSFAVANSQGAIPLPYDKYTCYYPQQTWIDLAQANTIHFIGAYRFHEGVYIQKASHSY